MEVISHFLLVRKSYSVGRLTFLNEIKKINLEILENNNSRFTQFFLLGDKHFTVSNNSNNLDSAVEYILITRRFDEPLIPLDIRYHVLAQFLFISRIR